ncbi:MAG: carbohydrate ABC transporter permease [Chloroflexota bacterium]
MRAQGLVGDKGGVARRRGPLTRLLDEMRREESRTAWLFLSPALLHMAIFLGFPVVYGFWLSLNEWNMVSPRITFVGLDNYANLLGDAKFLGSMANTVYFTLALLVAVLVCSLAVALLLDMPLRRIGLYRSIYYSPAVTSVVAIGVVWYWMFDPQYGLINQGLALLGIVGPRWLADSDLALPAVIMAAAWRNIGYFATIFLAGLQGIDASYYEAASMDGADRLAKFRHITLPLLAPTTFFVLVMTVIMSFQVFALVYVMTAGGPVGATRVVVFHLYQEAFVYFRLGSASAIGYVLFSVIFVLTLVQFRFLGKNSEV